MRWIVRIVLTLVAVAVVAFGLLLLLPADRIARIATDKFETATGRAMTIGGPVRPTIWPVLGVSTGPVTIANADWSGEGPMLRAESLAIGVDVLALIGGDIRITGVDAQAPQVVLEIHADGRANWDMAGPAAAAAPPPGGTPETPGGLPSFSLDAARIGGGKVTFIDHAAGSRTVLDRIEATLRLPDFNGTAELELAAAMNGQPLALSATIEGFAAFVTQGAVPVVLSAEAGASTLAFQGRAGLVPLAAGGTLDADLADLDAVFRLIGQPAPDLPRGLGQAIALTGEVTATDAGKVTLRDGTVRLDQNVLNAAADLDLSGARPRLTAQAAAGALDFSALGGDPATPAGNAADAPEGWSRTPIDASGMQAIDAEIALNAESVDLGLARFGRTRTLTALQDGRAVTEIRELAAYDGVVTGSFVVNSSGGLSVRANLAGAGVALQPLLTELAGYDRLQATGDLALNLLGSGNDMHTLMNSLAGDGAVSLGKGELFGLDLAGMVRNLDTSFIGDGQKTIFDSVTATFDVVNGQLTNENLAFLAPILNATGKGRVGIGAQDLDYRLLPVLLEGGDGKGIRVPVIVSGSWNSPRFRLDLEALVRQEFGDEIEKLKTEVEDTVVKRLNEELGVQADSLDTLEETLKKELENRATDGLRDLFGGNR